MDNPETIYFNEEWKPVYNPVNNTQEVETTDKVDNNSEKEIKKPNGKPLLTIVQIIICIILLFLLYSFKNSDSKTLKEYYKWYNKNLNNEITVSETFNEFSLDKIINAIENK